MSYIGNEPIVSATRTVTEVTATAGQTVFNANGGYTVGYLDVFLNGSKLTSTDFTATNGSSITLTEAAQVGDIVRLEAWGTFSTSNLVSPNYTGTLTGGTGVVNIGSGQVYKDASGNVGVGTSSPAYKLDVAGSIGIKSNDAFYRGTSVAGTSIRLLGLGADDNVYVGSVDSLTGSNTIFRTNGSERMRIDSNGVVRTTTRTGFSNSSGIIVTEGFSTKAGFNGAFSGNLFNINWTGSAALYIDTTNLGNIQLSSDYRIKRNIETQTEAALPKIMALRPVTYQMADYGTLFKASEEVKEGFIAHEVQEVIPSGAEGVKDAENQIQSLRVDAILAVAVKAIQEQQALIQSQADTITAMEARLTALEGKQ